MIIRLIDDVPDGPRAGDLQDKGVHPGDMVGHKKKPATRQIFQTERSDAIKRTNQQPTKEIEAALPGTVTGQARLDGIRLVSLWSVATAVGVGAAAPAAGRCASAAAGCGGGRAAPTGAAALRGRVGCTTKPVGRGAGQLCGIKDRAQRVQLLLGREDRASDQTIKIVALSNHGIKPIEIGLHHIDGFFVFGELEQCGCITPSHSRDGRIFPCHDALFSVLNSQGKTSQECGAKSL